MFILNPIIQMNKKIAIFYFLFCSFTVLSQEIVNDLYFNSNISSESYSLRSSSVSVALPFFDDFSNYTGYPNPNLWKDSDVYVNRSLPSNPINIGVATFDGLDSIGNPRNISSEFSHGPSDFLTSKNIDISNESFLYFSFYFQAHGLGNEPEPNDVLSLEFLDSLGAWNTIWDIEGQALNDFEKVSIEINDLTYFHDQFQFRFHNYASLSGNFDHWHIDNVLLTKELTLSNDNDDVAFVYETSKVLNEIAKKVAKENSLKVLEGTIATGDQFVHSTQRKEFIENTFNADALEMEGASVAMVCKSLNIPFFILRAISDSADMDAGFDFDEFLKSSAKNSADYIINIVNKIQ